MFGRFKKTPTPEPVKKHTPPPEEQIRVYRPGGEYQILDKPLSQRDIEIIIGAKPTYQYRSVMDVCYAESQQDKTTPVTCTIGDWECHGTIIIGKLSDHTMYPLAKKWFEGVNDSFVYSLLVWGAR